MKAVRVRKSSRTMLSNAAVSVMRKRCKEGLGFNCAFVDDDMNLLVALAQRALLAGLASDAPKDTLEKLTNAAERYRVEHEKALGRAIIKVIEKES